MLVAHLGRVPVYVPEEGLLAVVHELDRLAGVQRQHARVDLHRQVLAGTEGAAHTRQGQAHLVLGQPQGRADLLLVHVQPLRGHVQVHTAVLGGHRHPRLGTEEGLVLHPDLVLGGGHRVGFGTQALERLPLALVRPRHPGEVAGADRLVAHPVAGLVVLLVDLEGALLVDQRVLGVVRGPPRVADRVQDLVVDLDALHRPARRLRVVGGHHGHCLTLVAHLVVGEYGLVLELQAVALLAGHVLVCEHRRHTGDLQGLGDVDAQDLGVRVGAAQGRAPQHVLHPQVRRVGELAGDLQRPVGAARAGAQPVPGGAGQVRGHAVCGGLHQRLASCMRDRCAARPRAAAVSADRVRSSPRSTTVSPPTRSRSKGGVGPKVSATTGSAITS